MDSTTLILQPDPGTSFCSTGSIPKCRQPVAGTVTFSKTLGCAVDQTFSLKRVSPANPAVVIAHGRTLASTLKSGVIPDCGQMLKKKHPWPNAGIYNSKFVTAS